MTHAQGETKAGRINRKCISCATWLQLAYSPLSKINPPIRVTLQRREMTLAFRGVGGLYSASSCPSS